MSDQTVKAGESFDPKDCPLCDRADAVTWNLCTGCLGTGESIVTYGAGTDDYESLACMDCGGCGYEWSCICDAYFNCGGDDEIREQSRKNENERIARSMMQDMFEVNP
jgi:hypothetical protein